MVLRLKMYYVRYVRRNYFNMTTMTTTYYTTEKKEKKKGAIVKNSKRSELPRITCGRIDVTTNITATKTKKKLETKPPPSYTARGTPW